MGGFAASGPVAIHGRHRRTRADREGGGPPMPGIRDADTSL
jgi:hypothetical protein